MTSAGLPNVSPRSTFPTASCCQSLRALRGNSELQPIEREHDDAVVRDHADWYQRVDPSRQRSVAERPALLVLQPGHACIVHAAGLDSKTADLIADDVLTMHLAMLRAHLNPMTEVLGFLMWLPGIALSG